MNAMSVHSGDGLPPGTGGGEVPKSSQRLRKSQRLTRSDEIRETFNQGNKFVGRFMVLWFRRSDDASGRLAVVASRKVGNAVKRAKARRKLREVFRKNRAELCSTFDVVLVARGDIIRADSASIEDEFIRLVEKAGVTK